MYDPTAYENFKIIIEGSVYEADFSGDILVTGRTENIDLAVLERAYGISFVLQEEKSVTACIRVRSSLGQLSSEILEKEDGESGAFISIVFNIDRKKTGSNTQVNEITECLKEIWGEGRIYKVELREKYVNGKPIGNDILCEISFDRVITEEQADDLYTLVDYCIDSLRKLQRLKR